MQANGHAAIWIFFKEKKKKRRRANRQIYRVFHFGSIPIFLDKPTELLLIMKPPPSWELAFFNNYYYYYYSSRLMLKTTSSSLSVHYMYYRAGLHSASTKRIMLTYNPNCSCPAHTHEIAWTVHRGPKPARGSRKSL
jgi:hypothetical protein